MRFSLLFFLLLSTAEAGDPALARRILAARTPEEVLSITRASSAEEVMKAHRKILLEFHGEATRGDRVANEVMKVVNAARDEALKARPPLPPKPERSPPREERAAAPEPLKEEFKAQQNENYPLTERAPPNPYARECSKLYQKMEKIFGQKLDRRL